MSAITAENNGKQLPDILQADAQAEMLPARPAGLTARQETFCRLYAECGVPVEAYQAAYGVEQSRTSARVNAYKLLRVPKVAERVRQLQEAAAARSVRSTASLIAELEEMATADVNELVRLDVGSCEQCWGEDADRSREPNPDCVGCHGSGKPRVKFQSTADVSPGARRLLRGVELFPDGKVKRLLFHDQTALRIELHRLRGLHIERSMHVHANVNVPALDKMSREEQLAFLESLKPVSG